MLIFYLSSRTFSHCVQIPFWWLISVFLFHFWQSLSICFCKDKWSFKKLNKKIQVNELFSFVVILLSIKMQMLPGILQNSWIKRMQTTLVIFFFFWYYAELFLSSFSKFPAVLHFLNGNLHHKYAMQRRHNNELEESITFNSLAKYKESVWSNLLQN